MEVSLEELIEGSLKSPPDSRRDNKIVQILGDLEPPEALEVVKGMLLRGCPNAYYVACRVLGDRKSAEPFFVLGLTRADASTIREWILFAKHRIGVSRVAKHLKRREAEEPGVVDWARYWFTSILSEKEREEIERHLGES